MKWTKISKDGLPKEDGPVTIHAESRDPESPLIISCWYNPMAGFTLIPPVWIPSITHWMKIEVPNREKTR